MEKNKQLQGKKVGFISLGCDKNRVDTEKAIRRFTDAGAILTNDPETAQILMVNTCAFLESARKEAVETVLELSALKSGELEKLVVTGCLPELAPTELYEGLTEADVFAGFNDYDELVEAVARSYQTGRENIVGKGKGTDIQTRVLTTPLHYAYLKIADGCDNHCTYCLIPKIRGRYISTPMENLITEAENLGDVSELLLVAQDVTRYGEDLYGKPSLVPLLKKLTALPNVGAVRLLYCYPERIDGELIEEIASNPKIIKYLDIPLQHADDAVLKRMNRKGTYQSYLDLVATLRANVPNIAIRSTFIAGFPGETEENVQTLERFLRTAKLDNVGFFAYSKEEGTAAAKLPNQIPAREKKARVKRLATAQSENAKARAEKLLGKTVSVLCDGIDYDKGCFVGRSDFQAPDIDGVIYFTAEEGVQGERYLVTLNRYKNYDFYGTAIAQTRE